MNLRDANGLRVIDELRRHGTASRRDLSRLTGLSRTTVGALVSDLRAKGLVVEISEACSERERRGRGRPPSVLRLDPSAGAALGIDFDGHSMRVALSDLSATVLAERHEVLDRSAAGPVDVAVGLVREVLDEADVSLDQIVGVGLGLPGPVERQNGNGNGNGHVRPVDVDVRAALSHRLGLSVQVENDANLGTLGELTFGAARGKSDVVYLKLSSTIGAGLVLGGRLYRGSTGVAGELGHVQVRPEGAVCRCGYRGCLETVASPKALLALLQASYSPTLTVSDLLQLVSAGDVAATRLVNDAGRAVGRVLANLCNNLNPETIVVGGTLSAAGTPLFEGIEEEIDRYAQPAAAAAVEVRPGTLGERAEVLGALAFVIGNTNVLNPAGLAAQHASVG